MAFQSIRPVLLRGYSVDGFKFYINFGSKESKELVSLHASINFYYYRIGNKNVVGLILRKKTSMLEWPTKDHYTKLYNIQSINFSEKILIQHY